MTDETPTELDDDSEARRTAEVVSAYVSNNSVPANELPGLIDSIFTALRGLGGAAVVEEPAPEPAVNPKRSVKSDHIICLECGKKFKSLKRHLGAEHGMTPEEYRSKWGLAPDYPMVAPDYAAKRSDLAKTMGLGRKPGKKPAGKKK